MRGFVENPRRWPRAPARCRVAIAYRGGIWGCETEDVGPAGCQIVSPQLVPAGGEIQLFIASARVPGRLSVHGRVAWTTDAAPFRLGVAFTAPAPEGVPAWFNRLVKAEPEMREAVRRIPERLADKQMLYLGIPRPLVEFTADQISILREIGDGLRVGALRTREGGRWTTAQVALFSLLARGVVTLSHAEAVPGSRWRDALARAELAAAAESLGRPPIVAEPAPDASPRAVRFAQRPAAVPPPLPAWRLAARPERPAEAQRLVDSAAALLTIGDRSTAIADLRRALALSPGDGEIAVLLGRLVAQGRA